VLILASGSPQRQGLVEALGVEFEARPSEIEELEAGEPAEVVLENALRKALAALGEAREGALVLGADTAVVLDGRIHGKPRDVARAREHLRALSGRTHEVLTGLVVLGPIGKASEPRERTGVERSRVTFRDIDDALLERYVASGEWRGRAGGYAVQGLGSTLVERVDGELANVIGLPVRLLLRLAPELDRAPGADPGR
jgi:septum formation protein